MYRTNLDRPRPYGGPEGPETRSHSSTRGSSAISAPASYRPETFDVFRDVSPPRPIHPHILGTP